MPEQVEHRFAGDFSRAESVEEVLGLLVTDYADLHGLLGCSSRSTRCAARLIERIAEAERQVLALPRPRAD